MFSMNKLPLEKRVQILNMLVEGSSMRSIERVAGVSINTVSKLLVEAGKAAERFHDRTVKGLNTAQLQCDEIWSFCYAKKVNASKIKGEPEFVGDIWTFTRSPTLMRMKFLRILPEMWASTSWPLGSATRNMVPGKTWVTVPVNSIGSSLATLLGIV